ncbi:hypothetical protein LXA43DRAFT_1100505 [Ganoderma leucocontextum]|nr:hypothetical protein LXA43DRAFT_1100505 [Ganoderma leucocontextum]
MAPASIAIRNLVIRGNVLINMADYYEFFEQFLAPSSLRALTIESCDQSELRTFGRLLRSSAAQDLTSVSIDMVYGDYCTSSLLVDAQGGIKLQTVFQPLGAALAHCTRLQDVLIGFVHTDAAGDDPVSRRDAFIPILTNLPATLRTFAIHIR